MIPGAVNESENESVNVSGSAIGDVESGIFAEQESGIWIWTAEEILRVGGEESETLIATFKNKLSNKEIKESVFQRVSQ